jgi:DNA-binding IclR family transcriptional regulator
MRRGIQSIEIGTAILRALAKAPGPLQLRDIALAVGMPPSKAYKYLVSFAIAGLVKQDPSSGRYDLGPFSLELGLAALSRIDEFGIAEAALAGITAALQRDAQISVWTEHGPTVIRWKQGAKDVSIRVREGTLLPILTTATGRVFACYLPKSATAPLIEKELDNLQKASPQSRATLQDYYEEKIMAVRRFGMARAEGERRIGIDSLAGPIFSRDGIAFVITVLGPHGNFSFPYDGNMANEFSSILKQASIQLGAKVERPVPGKAANAS